MSHDDALTALQRLVEAAEKFPLFHARECDSVYGKECNCGHKTLRTALADARPALERLEAPRPRIVCLCGSTRFYEMFQRANYLETMAGNIVLSVGFYRPSPESEAEQVRYQHHGENIGCTPEQKIALDVLHKQKIDLADEVLVLNVGGYIGESTRSEIEHATKTGKPIRYLESPPAAVAQTKEPM